MKSGVQIQAVNVTLSLLSLLSLINILRINNQMHFCIFLQASSTLETYIPKTHHGYPDQSNLGDLLKIGVERLFVPLPTH